MHLFTWSSDKYRLGIPTIDAQHQHLINSICELFDTMNVTDDKHLINPMLSHLVSNCRKHFDEEERMMLEVHYPDIEAHIGRHMAFNEALASVVVHYQHGDMELALENLKYLSHWYIEHIKTADNHYCDFIKKKRVLRHSLHFCFCYTSTFSPRSSRAT